MLKRLLVPLLLIALFGCSSNDEVKEDEPLDITTQLDEVKSLVEQNELQTALELLRELEFVLSEENEEDLLKQVQAEIEHVKQLITNEKEQTNQLAKVLIDISDRYGFIPQNHQFHDFLGDMAFGIVHAQLIDFNNDGQNELYVLFRSTEYANDVFTHRI